VRDYEAMWEAAGGRVSASLGTARAVAVLGDDPDATAAVTLGLARAHAGNRRVFIFDLLGGDHGLVSQGEGDDAPGVSDMVQFGVSLGRAARARAESPNLFVVPGGAESPLSEGILTNRWWTVILDQVRRADALLLVAAPSMVPGIREMTAPFDGVVLVGEAAPPTPFVPVLAEVRVAATLRPHSTPTASERQPVPEARSSRWPLVAGVLALAGAVALGAVTAPRWRPLLGLGGAEATVDATDLPPVPPATAAAPAGSEAAFSVELLFTNSGEDAVSYLAPAADTLPAATFSIVSIGPESDAWYRLIAGAFPDSATADRYLTQLREQGRLATGAGTIARTPFALLLDSASSDALAQVRVAAYRGRGIPAYVLRDAAMVWRVYAGAFPAEGDSELLKRHLDSLNIQSALVMRAGSTP
jgi:hypothetical protein